ncbi:hypothetical protein MKJ04_20835 [Pontibacter sp. E15-1]|uniref:hypothetical protein n=1 Tax=Pontibacter sp. E15-1 TaxID=2919918 RepID=UPI001F4FAAF2|nr:hypothetical protein [Pontibacter sp. E15-1]MCJ8167299.1 hypothetical protein [Pontibacter sp. E15-1]
MKVTYLKTLLLAGGILFVAASCSSTRKNPSRTGKVIVIDDARHDRTGNGRKDNGKHKGWHKNSNNPHHPNTTNPGHTKHKGDKYDKHGKGEKHHKHKNH